MPESQSEPSTPGPLSVAGENLQRAIADLPPTKQTEIKQQFERVFMGFMGLVDRSSAPRIDPETARILTESIDKDNENKFKYLSQKQADSAIQQGRDHELSMTRHRDGFGLLKPMIFAAITIVVFSVGAGIYFIANGKEAVGSALLTGIFGLLFGYLGGLGTSRFMRPDR